MNTVLGSDGRRSHITRIPAERPRAQVRSAERKRKRGSATEAQERKTDPVDGLRGLNTERGRYSCEQAVEEHSARAEAVP